MKRKLSLTCILILFFGSMSLCQAQTQSANAILAGYKASPPVTTPGTGSVTVTLKGDTLIVEGSFSDLSSRIRGAAIHFGSSGENGNQLIRLHTTVSPDTVTSGLLDPSRNRFRLTPAIKDALADGRLYILVYTQRHSRGEIRTQIPALSSG